MNEKTIVIFSAFYPPHVGGVEKYSRHLAERLTKIGYKVIVATSNTEGSPDIENAEGIDIYRLPVYNFIKGRLPVPKPNSKTRNILQKVRNLKADIFLINMRIYPMSLIAARISRKVGASSILIEHTTGHFTVNNRFLDFLGRIYERTITWLIKNKIDYFMGVSASCNEWLRNFGINPQRILYNGVDIQAETRASANIEKKLTIPADKIVFSYAGRLIEEKGVKKMCAAFEKITEEYSGVHLCAAGDGPLLDELRYQYDDNSAISFPGRLSHDDTMALLRISASVIIPSCYPEGLPTLILEAGINKCAVVATPMGGSEEVIRGKEYGLIIEPGSVESIYQAIKTLIENADLRTEIALNLNKMVEENFSWEKIVLDFDQFIRSNGI